MSLLPVIHSPMASSFQVVELGFWIWRVFAWLVSTLYSPTAGHYGAVRGGMEGVACKDMCKQLLERKHHQQDASQ